MFVPSEIRSESDYHSCVRQLEAMEPTNPGYSQLMSRIRQYERKQFVQNPKDAIVF